jgi:hypothetical protein
VPELDFGIRNQAEECAIYIESGSPHSRLIDGDELEEHLVEVCHSCRRLSVGVDEVAAVSTCSSG